MVGIVTRPANRVKIGARCLENRLNKPDSLLIAAGAVIEVMHDRNGRAELTDQQIAKQIVQGYSSQSDSTI
jgi:hypothetical protein